MQTNYNPYARLTVSVTALSDLQFSVPTLVYPPHHPSQLRRKCAYPLTRLAVSNMAGP